jgi:adenosylcobyric acid synthase
LFEDGKRKLEELTGLPVIGILPYFRDIHIEQEDSVSLELKYKSAVEGKVNIAVVLLKRLSNFTDFDRLEKDPRVNLFYSNDPSEISKASIVIIPGSKNTIGDMLAIKNNGVAKAIYDAHKAGKTVIGICGGYQMLGESIMDPHHIEGDIEQIPGLGLLPVTTVLQPEKTTLQCIFEFQGMEGTGYEIHMGETTALSPGQPVATLADGRRDGYYLDHKTWGSYIHGILDNSAVINSILAPYTDEKGIHYDYKKFKEGQYDKLAELLRSHIHMDLIYKSLAI